MPRTINSAKATWPCEGNQEAIQLGLGTVLESYKTW